MTHAILWKKNRTASRVPRNQINVITLNQTVWIKIILCIDTLLVLSLKNIIAEDKMFHFEMLKVIIIDNFCYRFLFPLYLIRNTKSWLPILWSEQEIKKVKFYNSEHQLKPRDQCFINGNINNSNKMEQCRIHVEPRIIYVKEAKQKRFSYLGK